MMNQFNKVVLISILLLTLEGIAQGQPGRSKTPESIRYEEKFIEAQKQKLLGNREEAIDILENLSDKVDTIGGVYYELARLYAAGNNYKKALENIDRAVRLEAEFQPFWEVKAKIEVEAGEANQAASSYSRLTKLAPDQQEFYEGLANCYERMGSLDKSIEVWDRIERHFGISETIARKKHMLYHSMGKTKQAEQELIHWAELRPKHTRPLLLLAQYRERIGEPAKAREAYEQILEIDPDHSEAKLGTLSHYKSDGNDRDFLESLEAIVGDPGAPVDLKVKQMIPYVEKLADGDTSLVSGLDKLSGLLRDLHGEDAKSWSISGDIAYYSGDKDRAVTYYKKTIELNPKVFPVWEQLLRTLAETHQYEALEKQAERARDYFPNQGLILYFKGLGLFGTNAYEEAESILNQSLIMSSASPQMQADIYALLSSVALRNNDPSASKEYVEKGLSKVSNHPDLLLQKATLLIYNEEDLAEATNILNRVEQLVPHTVEVAHLRGWIELKRGSDARALDLLSKALEASTYPTPELLEHYGDALRATGADQKAKKYWEQALEQGGTRDRLETKIQSLPEQQ